MKTLLPLILTLFVLTACNQANVQPSTASNAPSETAPAVVSDARLVAMAYNIRYDNEGDGANAWPKRADKVAEMIRSNQVDFGGLQEVLNSQFIWLNENLAEYDFVGVGRKDGQTQGEYAPVFWKKDRFTLESWETRWLSETPNQAGSVGWDAALPRIVTFAQLTENATGEQYLVGSAHYDHRGGKARRNSNQVIADYVQAALSENPDLKVYLTGDFNELNHSRTIRELQSKTGLVDARKLTKNRMGPNSTWNGFTSIDPGYRIDYIFTQPENPILGQVIDDRRIDKRWPSDHLPVVVWIE